MSADNQWKIPKGIWKMSGVVWDRDGKEVFRTDCTVESQDAPDIKAELDVLVTEALAKGRLSSN